LERPRDRAVDGADVPDLPAAAPRRVAGRRLRRPPRLWPGVEDPDPDCARARATWRSVPALPHGPGVVLLARGGALRRGRRERGDTVTTLRRREARAGSMGAGCGSPGDHAADLVALAR